jgi:hypothetical protein
MVAGCVILASHRRDELRESSYKAERVVDQFRSNREIGDGRRGEHRPDDDRISLEAESERNAGNKAEYTVIE